MRPRRGALSTGTDAPQRCPQDAIHHRQFTGTIARHKVFTGVFRARGSIYNAHNGPLSCKSRGLDARLRPDARIELSPVKSTVGWRGDTRDLTHRTREWGRFGAATSEAG